MVKYTIKEMTYKEKRKETKNIQCFSLIRLVKDVLYEGHDKPFFSFYDGDYFKRSSNF